MEEPQVIPTNEQEPGRKSQAATIQPGLLEPGVVEVQEEQAGNCGRHHHSPLLHVMRPVRGILLSVSAGLPIRSSRSTPATPGLQKPRGKLQPAARRLWPGVSRSTWHSARRSWVVDKEQIYPISLFVKGQPYKLLGLIPMRHSSLRCEHGKIPRWHCLPVWHRPPRARPFLAHPLRWAAVAAAGFDRAILYPDPGNGDGRDLRLLRRHDRHPDPASGRVRRRFPGYSAVYGAGRGDPG